MTTMSDTDSPRAPSCSARAGRQQHPHLSINGKAGSHREVKGNGMQTNCWEEGSSEGAAPRAPGSAPASSLGAVGAAGGQGSWLQAAPSSSELKV